MLRVAARIVAGDLRGLMFGYLDSGAGISVQWDWVDGDHHVAGSTGEDDHNWPGPVKMAGSFPSDDEDVEEYDDFSLVERKGDHSAEDRRATADEDAELVRSWSLD
jgi:hypothetical protein